MEGKMKTAVMLGIGKIGFEERDIPKVKDNEVLVKLEYVGICGSDLHYYETGAIGDYVVKPPFVLGHEPGGTVVETGKNVRHLKVGDRVLWSRERHADTVNSAGREDTIFVRMWYFSQRLRLTAYFRSMWSMKLISALNCRTMSAHWRERSLNLLRSDSMQRSREMPISDRRQW